jgi:hypothetical protein
MPCQELIELEASSHRYNERRQETATPAKERRAGKSAGFRAGAARYAFIIMNHRQSCKICSALLQPVS